MEDAKCEGETLTERLKSEFPDLAGKLAALVDALEAHRNRRAELEHRARDFGQQLALPNPEAFRRAPVTWGAAWPSPDGTHTIWGDAKDAPRGALKWSNGVPEPARDDVTVRRQGGEAPESLIRTVNLPGLRHGEKPIRRAAEDERKPSVAEVQHSIRAAREAHAREAERAVDRDTGGLLRTILAGPGK